MCARTCACACARACVRVSVCLWVCVGEGPVLFAHIEVGQDALDAADAVRHADEERRVSNHCAAREVGVGRRQQGHDEPRMLWSASVIDRGLQPAYAAEQVTCKWGMTVCGDSRGGRNACVTYCARACCKHARVLHCERLTVRASRWACCASCVERRVRAVLGA